MSPPDDYLERILTSRVYDVAIESPLDVAHNLSRRLNNQILLKREDLQRVAKKYLQPDRMILVVVGDEKKFDKPLATFGKVREVVPEAAR
jgi:hypothetical protein